MRRQDTYDSVDTGKVLQDEQHMTQEQPPKDLVVSQSKLDGLEEALWYLVIGSLHHFNLLNDILIGRFEIANPAKVFDGLLATTFAEEPTWCFPKHHAADQDHPGWYKLHGERNQELVSSGQR